MRILGVDPGLERTGWGLVDSSGQTFSPVDYGLVATDSKTSLAGRLSVIYNDLAAIVRKYSPDVLAVEELFFAKNAKTAIDVGQARGVVVLIAGQMSIPLEELTPLQVKSTMVGFGNASKDQVGFMVKSLLGLPRVPRPDDVADALAVAIAAGIQRSFRARLVSRQDDRSR